MQLCSFGKRRHDDAVEHQSDDGDREELGRVGA